ncbi:DUF1850 domain-containing protein [Nitratireductor mangrovi]|uniref:DUF1850 domain-containing protein n=1 Tax=Nitratireductor mangrovi TaxID=2599600 RepID=A0A5B8KYL9_9HYPH|nr:DUF1850 domain-containing protein [Nitratireductor mangrovi]QDZ00669.1 DUF1850 domain-containing protein [Nitratireductor mangrovi]
MSLCLIAGAKATAIAATAFTLSWTHSVERTSWREDWRVTPQGLVLEEARVQGSGAGMEPPEGAVLADGWWVYRPALPPLPALVLAASGATAGGWRLCAGGECRTLGSASGAPITLRPCVDEQSANMPAN